MKKAFTTLGLVIVALFSLTACTKKTQISRIKLTEYSQINIGDTLDIVPIYEAIDADEDEIAKASQELKLIWLSSDETVATVENGKVTGISFGEAVISLSTEDKSLAAETVVKVKSPVEDVVAEDINIKVQDREKEIEYALVPEGVEADVSFSIVDETVAKIINGKITAVKPGETELIIKADDKEKVVKVIVKEVKKETVKPTVSKAPSNNASTNNSPVSSIPPVTAKPVPAPTPAPVLTPVTPTPAPPEPPISIPDKPLDNNQNVGDTHNPGYSAADNPVIED